MRNILGFVCLSVGQFVPWSVALQNLIVPIAFQLGPDFFKFINSALRPLYGQVSRHDKTQVLVFFLTFIKFIVLCPKKKFLKLF